MSKFKLLYSNKLMKLNFLVIGFIVIIGCTDRAKHDALVDELNGYSETHEELKSITFDYNKLSKNKERLKGCEGLLGNLSSFVKEHFPNVGYEFVEERTDGEVYVLFSLTDDSERRYVLMKESKIVSPQCFLTGDEISFCW